jgi:hypothetical protein
MTPTTLESLGASIPDLSFPSSISSSLPSFFFHYLICAICVTYLVCIAVLKFKYYYWYNQPLVFRFSVRRFGIARQNSTFTSINYSIKNGDVFPLIVDCENVKVYSTRIDSASYLSIPFEKIAELLNKDENVIVNHRGGGGGGGGGGQLIPYVHPERLACTVTNDTHGLSAFVGVYISPVSSSIYGVCILTPRIKIERDRTAANPLSTSIYLCEHLAWSHYDVSDRQSLELLETTQSIQRVKEISGEQTLYRYNEIPWFVTPFTTVYTYALSLERMFSHSTQSGIGRVHTTAVKVSSVNFALFYAFINERSRDFSCSILNEITHLQHLIQSGIYHIYMLLLNNTRVLSVYIYGPSWKAAAAIVSGEARAPGAPIIHKKKTRGNRIERLHNYISRTSTAVIKYLPPVKLPKYDVSGKRIGSASSSSSGGKGDSTLYDPSIETVCLLSSVCDKRVCEPDTLSDGFIQSLKIRMREIGGSKQYTSNIVLIDTIAHNYMIIDNIVRHATIPSPSLSPVVVWQHKWYYVLYNAIIYREILCKDLFMV